jgi:hypothetical protein
MLKQLFSLRFPGRLFCIVALSASFFGCPERTPLTDEELTQAYQAAIADAAVAEAAEISRNLTPITDDNPDLFWDDSTTKSRVLVVTWTSYEGYDSYAGQEMTLSRDVWVTVVPDIKDFCRTHSSEMSDPELRIEQLIGLPPHYGDTRFVELLAKPSDMFRPSPDPEITDCEATLYFPCVAGYLTVSDDYVSWFNTLKGESYTDNGYPWTRLGYTYDWGGYGSEIGLSEFIVRSGAVVKVSGVYLNDDYLESTEQ